MGGPNGALSCETIDVIDWFCEGTAIFAGTGAWFAGAGGGAGGG